MVVLPDGKVLAGGSFTSFEGQPRTNLVRLIADGTAVDQTFTLGTEQTGLNQGVLAMAVQPDGKVVVVGGFTKLGGQPRQGVGRLNADGTLDTGFVPLDVGRILNKDCLVIQDDGKILVGGSALIRLNANGVADPSFTVRIGGAGSPAVSALALQGDGKILVGGQFTALDGQARSNLARLNPDGTLDPTFNATCDRAVQTLAAEPDGKILVGGSFSTLDGSSVGGLGRLNPDGTLDPGFNPQVLGEVYCLAPEADGSIIVGQSGGFRRVRADGTTDPNFVSLRFFYPESAAIGPDGAAILLGAIEMSTGIQPYVEWAGSTNPATQSLFYNGTGSITWLRGGSAPEIWRALVETSTDGTNWVKLGEGTHVEGGWQLEGVSLKTGQLMRARGWITGSSAGLVSETQTVIQGPAIVASPSSRTNFTDTPVTLHAYAAASSPLGYQWYKDGAAILGATNNSLALPDLQLADAGAYTMTATNANGSQTTPAAILTVVPRPEIAAWFGPHPGGQMELVLAGPPRQQVIIESSTNLVSWQELGTAVLSTKPVPYFDLSSGASAQRFYRLRVP